jgi:hypothetical protein
LTRPTDSQQVVPTSMISSARNKLLTSWWQQARIATCYEQPVLVLLEQLVANLLPSSTLWQGDNNLFQICHNNWEQAVRRYPDISLTTTLLQLVCRFETTCVFLRVYTASKKWIWTIRCLKM